MEKKDNAAAIFLAASNLVRGLSISGLVGALGNLTPAYRLCHYILVFHLYTLHQPRRCHDELCGERAQFAVGRKVIANPHGK